MACAKGVSAIIAGIVFTFIGFVMTMYGFLHEPFWDEDDTWCDFCMDERETELRNIENCRIAGPVFLAIGMIVFIYGYMTYKRYRHINVTSNPGVVMSTAAPAAVGYPMNPAPQFAGGYHQQAVGYPPQAGGYAPQAVGYPAQGVGYPPQAHGYPAQPVNYAPQVGGYPPQAVGYHPQAVGYPQQASGYAQQPVGFHAAQNSPPQTTGEGEPSAPPPYEPGVSAPPPPAY